MASITSPGAKKAVMIVGISVKTGRVKTTPPTTMTPKAHNRPSAMPIQLTPCRVTSAPLCPAPFRPAPRG